MTHVLFENISTKNIFQLRNGKVIPLNVTTLLIVFFTQGVNMIANGPGNRMRAPEPFISSFEDVLRLTSYGHNAYTDRLKMTLIFPAAVLTGALLAELLVMLYPIPHFCAPFQPLVAQDYEYQNSSATWQTTNVVLDESKNYNNFSKKSTNCALHLPSTINSQDDKNVLICPAGFEWDTSEIFTGSLVRKLEWICKKESFHTSAIVLMLYGFVFGGMVVGAVADGSGRIKTLAVTCLLNAILRIFLLWSMYISDQILFWVVLFWYSCTLSPIIVLPLVTATENFNSEERTRIFPAVTALYPLGFCITLFLYSESSLWYYIFVGLFTILLSLPIFAYWSTIYEESLRWLYFHRKFEKCARILRYVAVANDVRYFSKDYYKTCLRRLWDERGPLSLRNSEFSFSWRIYCRAILAAFPMMFNSIMIVLSIIHVPLLQNIHYMAVESLLFMSFCVLAIFPVMKLVRSKCVGGCCTQIVLYTVSLLFYLLLYKHQKSTGVVGLFVLLTWVCLALSSSISFMMCVELMPTVTRAMHLGSFMSISALFGFATYVLEELLIHNNLINGQVFMFCVVMCAIGMVAVSLTIETGDTNLPDTYMDMQMLVYQNHFEQGEV